MGTVHLAFDHLILREVALKTLREDLSESEDLQQHFIEEAQLTGQLDHPHIVPVYEVTTSSDGVAPSVIMRYVDGETYSELVERLHASPTDAQLHETLQVFLKVCDAMSFAHERGVIHCDLKPENITVGKHGQVYVMDWGVAFLREGEQLSPRRTGPDGTSLRSRGLRHSPLGGTLAYMAPEQLTGDRSVINATTDVYGLGGILCVLLTGKPPRTEASAVADWYQTPRLEDRKAMAEVPPELCRIAERALSPAQADRFQSVDELKYEMEAFMAGGGWFATRRYLAGDVIIREGDSGAEAFIISSGVCDVFRGKLEGPRQFIRSMGPGDTFGELSVLTRKPRSASVVAQTDVSLRLVTVDALDRELKRNPVLASFMSAVTSRFCDLEARLDASQE
jgi:serine/threonine-protein kinase